MSRRKQLSKLLPMVEKQTAKYLDTISDDIIHGKKNVTADILAAADKVIPTSFLKWGVSFWHATTKLTDVGYVGKPFLGDFPLLARIFSMYAKDNNATALTHISGDVALLLLLKSWSFFYHNHCDGELTLKCLGNELNDDFIEYAIIFYGPLAWRGYGKWLLQRVDEDKDAVRKAS